MSTLILITVIALIILLGRYAVAEGQRVERNKKFMKDFREFDAKQRRQNGTR